MSEIFDRGASLIDVSGKSVVHIGRVQQGNDLALPHPAVSAHHARLELRADGWYVVDLESDFGSYVNYRRAGPQGYPLRPGVDTLWIAPYALRLSAGGAEQTPRPAQLRLDAVNLLRKAGSRTLLDLQGTPISFHPGEFVAIVGGSGAGKSTFLKALLNMDTLPPGGRKGAVYFSNQPFLRDAEAIPFTPLNTILGYVPQQDDSLHFQLTPIQALDYNARLRFAADISPKERTQRIQSALAAVRIERPELQNRPISQLSGGQRKRVNVAMELLVEPRVLFLDEPTSGLDPGLDLEMMRLLQTWAQGAADQDPKTILLITHATENVRLCDRIIFLGRTRVNDQDVGGQLLYIGPPGQPASDFFGCQTFSEVYQAVDDPRFAAAMHTKLVDDPAWNAALWQRGRTAADAQETAALEAGRARPEPAQASPAHAAARPPAAAPRRGPLTALFAKKPRRQFGILSERYFRLLRSDRGAFTFQVLQGFLVALLLWAVAQVDSFTIAGVREAPTTLLILSISAAWLGLLNAAKEIVKERCVFGRERRYGLDPGAYVLSKFSVLAGLGVWQMATLLILLTVRLDPETRMGAIGRGLPGFETGVLPLIIEWFITLLLLLCAGLALGLCLSAFSATQDQASMIMFPAMLVQVILAGILFNVGPLAWLSFTHWGVRALGGSLDLTEMFYAAGKASDPVLDTVNFGGSGWELALCWLVLLGYILFFLSIAVWRQSQADKARIPEN